MWAEGEKEGLMRPRRGPASVGWERAKVKGLRRLERSERGWPIVDISQLDGESRWLAFSGGERSYNTYSNIPITLDSVLWYTRLSIL